MAAGLTEHDRMVIRAEFRPRKEFEFVAAAIVSDGRHEDALEIAYKTQDGKIRYVTVDLLRAAARECARIAK